MLDVIKTTHMNDGLYRVEVIHHGRRDRALWTAGKARKEAKCATCRKLTQPGDNVFRPIGNQLYRMERLCEDCVK